MNNDPLDRYVAEKYRRDILGESVEVGMPEVNPQLLADVRAEIARIHALKLGANLSRRCFATYQRLQALEDLLYRLERQEAVDAADP